MEDNCKREDAEMLQKIIFHLSEARKLFNDLKYRTVGVLEQREWENTVKLCKDSIEFVNGKVDSIRKIIR